MTLKNKKILITGASKGLGAEFAKYAESNGAIVCLVARDIGKLEELKNSFSNPAIHCVKYLDLLDMGSIEKVVQSIIDEMNTIDIIFHAAGGGYGAHDPLLSHEMFLKLFNVNVAAAVEINRVLVPYLREQKSGVILHVGSIASYEAVGSVGYNTVKACLPAYVRSIGRELASEGITVSGILPGGFISEGNAMGRLKHKNPDAYQAFINERLPRKKMGSVSEIFPLINFLCSESGGMMTGCMVPIDAGEGKTFTFP